MATLISSASGNLTGASTFAAAETSSLKLIRGTQQQGVSSTTPVSSSAFTVANGAVVDALVLWLKNSTSSPSGTLLVELQKSNVTQASVTVNKSDLPPNANSNPSPVVFKFGATATGDGAATWTIKLTNSVASSIIVQAASGSSLDFTRALRTTAPATPANADDLIICGELTGAGTGTDITVTMDQTSTSPMYGSALLNSTTVAGGGVHIGKRGTLSYGTAAATNYVLRVSGDLVVWDGARLELGTVATPIPRGSTAVLEFQQSSLDGDFGLTVQDGATYVAQGLSRTAGLNVVSCLLAADAAVSATSFTVDRQTGWLSGDMIAMASTTRTNSQCEVGKLTADAGASSLSANGWVAAASGQTLPLPGTGGLINAHSGTSPTQAEIINLTRNVVVRSTSASLMSYCFFAKLASVDLDWVEHLRLGTNTAGKRCVEIEATSSGTATAKTIHYCSWHNCEAHGLYLNGVGGAISLNTVAAYNVFWATPTVTTSHAVTLGNFLTYGDWTLDNNIVIRTLASSSSGFNLADIGGTFTNNTAVGTASAGITTNEAGSIGTWSGNTAHSTGGTGITVTTGNMTGSIFNTTIWRANGNGLLLNGPSGLVFDGLTMFGCLTTNLSSQSQWPMDYTVKNGAFHGDSSFSVTNNVTAGQLSGLIRFENCTFSAPTGIKTAATNDFAISSAMAARIELHNCTLGASTEVSAQASMAKGLGYIASQRHDGTAGNHVLWVREGRVQSDTAIWRTALPSLRLTSTSINGFAVSAVSGQPTISPTGVGITNFVVGGFLYNLTYFPNGATITAISHQSNTLTLDTNSSATGSVSPIYYERLASAPPGQGVKVPVNAGQTVTISVWVRKSVVGDAGGAAFIGAQPRLIQRASPAVGITSDIVLATATGGNGTWEQLSATCTAPTGDNAVLEFVVDSVGSAGWVNVDDFAVS